MDKILLQKAYDIMYNAEIEAKELLNQLSDEPEIYNGKNYLLEGYNNINTNGISRVLAFYEIEELTENNIY